MTRNGEDIIEIILSVDEDVWVGSSDGVLGKRKVMSWNHAIILNQQQNEPDYCKNCCQKYLNGSDKNSVGSLPAKSPFSQPAGFNG